ncbi:PREDICTED: kinetochore-associated protein 1-like isoform X2 [Thamnophis sirtalis]|uniref:Kinetochore-associated protein 1-like isoform X2 n=1 Tax=Thamnophis sirtalis TaxID=35019 RepID=A0A6I9YJC9_9SAUR|nr:PREDICTED: kinetochore-associated protein 1-like isoform X2 [Thamnophis sirtalis]
MCDHMCIIQCFSTVAILRGVDLNSQNTPAGRAFMKPRKSYRLPLFQPIGVNQLTFAHRSRALQCLLFLADPSAIESLFKKPMEKVRNFMKCFVYLAQLEALNIPYTYESFHRAPKEGMIKGLWKNHSHEPKAVKLVAELSLQYEVYDPLLWNGLLQKLMGFKMVRAFPFLPSPLPHPTPPGTNGGALRNPESSTV